MNITDIAIARLVLAKDESVPPLNLKQLFAHVMHATAIDVLVRKSNLETKESPKYVENKNEIPK